MLTSMTGFGRAEVQLPALGTAVVEIHTLNHRFLEVECRLPEGLQPLEERIRALAAHSFRRGRVKVSVALKSREFRPAAVFQTAAARQYVALLRKFQRQLRIPGAVTLEMVLGLPEVVTLPRRDLVPNQWWPRLRAGVSQALENAVKMRRQEGKALSRILVNIVAKLESLSGKIRRRLPVAERNLKKRLSARMKMLGGSVDKKALAHEAATLVQANDVSEELARIRSHLAGLTQVVAGSVESPGRTADFIAQELHREVNTLGVKARDSAAIHWVVAMKGEIEKLREQAANVE